MQLLRDEKGEGRAKFIITIIIVAFVGFCLYQFVRARINVYEFKDSVGQTVKKYAQDPRLKEDDVKDELLKLAEEKLGFELKEEELKVTVDSREIKVNAEYVMPVKFPLYTWNWKQVIDYQFRRF